MTFRLEYELAATGTDRIRRALRGIEGEARASASRLDRDVARARRAGPSGVDREAQARLRAAASLERQRSSALYRQYQLEQRLAARSEAMQLRAIRKRESEEVRAARRAAAARVRTVERIGRGAAGAVGRGVTGALGMAGRVVGIGAGVLGGIAGANALTDEVRVRAQASRLANQGLRSVQEAKPGTTLPGLKGELLGLSGSVKGFSREETLGALGSFTDITGDLATGMSLLQDLGKLSLATGTDIAELGATAGNAFIPIADQIKEPTKRLEMMRDVMAALAGQGAEGAVEIKDLASEFAGLAATANRFAGPKGEMLKVMGAFAQAARQRGGASSAPEAVTSVERFASDLLGKPAQKALSGMGINVFADKGKTQLKDPREILVDVLKKTGGDLTKVSSVFNERSIRAFMGFAPVYTEAERKKKGSGEAAVRAEMARFMSAQLSAGDIEMRATSRAGDEDVKLQEAVKKFNEEVGRRLIPVLTELIPKFEEAIPKLATFAEKVADAAGWLAKNPFDGLGLLISGFVAKELAVAGITGGVSSLIGSAATGLVGTAAGAAGAGVAAGGGTAAAGAGAAAGIPILAGLAAVGGVGAAGYQAYQLTKDIQRGGGIGDIWDLLTKGPAKGTSREEYDKIYGVKPNAPAATGGAPNTGDNGAGAMLEQSAQKAGDIIGTAVVAKLASAQMPNDPRRSNPVIAR